MKLLKSIILGITCGLLFAVVVFVLITPYLRGNVPAILSWGFQGFLFAISFHLIDSILHRCNRDEIIWKILVGGVSGLVSTSFNIFVTIRNFFSHDTSVDVFHPPKMIQGLYFELTLYASGCVIIGMVIGIMVYYKSNAIKAKT